MKNPLSIARYATRALAASALLFAVALPMALPSVAGAATSVTTATFTPGGAGFFGQGASGTVAISGAGFANNGGTVTIASTAPGLTFSSGAESSSSAASANFASTAATTPGSYTLTLSDSNGTSTPPTAFTVNAAPTITLVSPSTLSDGNGPTTVTITGTGFTTATSPTVGVVSAVNGTSLTVGPVVGNTATSLSFSLTPTNSVTSDPATAGAYNVTVTNSDGGTTTSANAISITAYGAANVSPSAVPAVTSATNTPITISGAGFEVGAAVTLSGAVCTGSASGHDNAQITGAVVTSASLITATLAQGTPTGTNTPAECSLTVANPSVIDGGNGATFTLPGAIGIAEASTVAPVITATSATTAIVPGSPASALTLTGAGFSYETTAAAFTGTSTNPAAGVTLTNTGANTGTSAAFNVTVASGATAGPDNAVATNDVSASNAFPAALTVAGPVIVSQTPAAIAVGAPAGTSITLTGTGFTNTTTGTVSPGATGLAGLVSYVSPTTMSLVVTTPPTGASSISPATVTLTQIETGGATSVSPPFSLTIDNDPVVTSAVTYASASDVGAGATAQTVYFHGTGFAAGATVTAFVNGAAVADPSVVATVTSVTPTLITAKVAIAAGDANIADGYTVTNTDGGFYKVSAIQYPLVIGAGPTITAVSPATAIASATNAFTITGTGFQSGVVVTATSDGTCTTATLTGTTSIAVSCTLGAAPAAPAAGVALTVTNPDGGSATTAVVLPATSVVVVVVGGPKITKITHAVLHRGHTVTFVIRGTNLAGATVTTGTNLARARTVLDTTTVLVVNVSVNRFAPSRVYHLTIRTSHGAARVGFSVFR